MQGIVDRIEDGMLVIELDDDTFHYIPCSDVPQASEGDVLQLDEGRIQIDYVATQRRKEAMQRLKNRVFQQC